jgi:ABC-type spermidine/putrescine transport system permease subunit II
VAHICAFAPLAYFLIRSSSERLSASAYLVATNLQISDRVYFHAVFLNGARSGLIVGLLLMCVFSFNDSLLARYVGGFDRTLAILIADQQVSSLDPSLYLLLALTMLSVTAFLQVGMHLAFPKPRASERS